MIYLVLIAGIYNVFGALVINTKNFFSAVLFKVIPFFLGASCVVFALKALNIL